MLTLDSRLLRHHQEKLPAELSTKVRRMLHNRVAWQKWYKNPVNAQGFPLSPNQHEENNGQCWNVLMSPLGVLQRPCSTSTRLQHGHAEYTASGHFGVTYTDNVQKILYGIWRRRSGSVRNIKLFTFLFRFSPHCTATEGAELDATGDIFSLTWWSLWVYISLTLLASVQVLVIWWIR